MKLCNISRKEVIRLALEALPHSNEGHAIVVVDVRNGSVEVLTKTDEFENWAKYDFNHKTVIFDITEEEAGLGIDALYKKHRHEICCTISEIKDMYPHLK